MLSALCLTLMKCWVVVLAAACLLLSHPFWWLRLHPPTPADCLGTCFHGLGTYLHGLVLVSMVWVLVSIIWVLVSIGSNTCFHGLGTCLPGLGTCLHGLGTCHHNSGTRFHRFEYLSPCFGDLSPWFEYLSPWFEYLSPWFKYLSPWWGICIYGLVTCFHGLSESGSEFVAVGWFSLVFAFSNGWSVWEIIDVVWLSGLCDEWCASKCFCSLVSCGGRVRLKWSAVKEGWNIY